MIGATNLRVIRDVAAPIDWDTLTVREPGLYRICLPTEDQASDLKHWRPDGSLTIISGQRVWIERIRPSFF